MIRLGLKALNHILVAEEDIPKTATTVQVPIFDFWRLQPEHSSDLSAIHRLNLKSSPAT